jgi:hypothetical protein
MEAATALLEELGVAPTMTTATAQHLRDVAASGPGVEGLPVA